MGRQKLPILMSPIRTNICPTGFLQNNETCGGSTSIHGDSSSHLPRRHPSNASSNGATDTADSIDMPAIRGSGSGGQSKEIHAVPSAYPGVLGLPSGYSEPTADFPGREAEKNTAVSLAPPAPIKGFSEGSSEDFGKDLGGYMANSSAFQSTTIPNKFSDARGPLCGLRGDLQLREVQYQSDLDQGGQEQPQLVVCSRQEGPDAISPSAQDTDYDNRVGCLQHGMGSPTRQATDRWKVVSSRNCSPYQLSRTVSCLSSPTVLC